MRPLYLLFCESPLQSNKVDEDYEDQWRAAEQNGFSTLLYNYEDLVSKDRFLKATRRIKPAEQTGTVIYRGWMLTPQQYAFLYDDLQSKNYQLINTPEEYRNCHYLPDSLRFIGANTPKTIFEKLENENSLDVLLEKSRVFADKPVILKDYVKSEKHDWETACFVRNAADLDNLKQSIHNLLDLRGKYLNEGIVIREFLELNALTVHSKSGMPLTEEYRLFFCNRQLVGRYDYWEEGDYHFPKPDIDAFETIAQRVESNFFSMDIARKKNGELVIIELGDGQVAGLPDRTDRNEFYKRLKDCCS